MHTDIYTQILKIRLDHNCAKKIILWYTQADKGMHNSTTHQVLSLCHFGICVYGRYTPRYRLDNHSLGTDGFTAMSGTHTHSLWSSPSIHVSDTFSSWMLQFARRGVEGGEGERAHTQGQRYTAQCNARFIAAMCKHVHRSTACFLFFLSLLRGPL